MNESLVKYCGAIVSQSDLRAGTQDFFFTRKEDKSNKKNSNVECSIIVTMWKVGNLKLEISKMKVKMIGVSELRWTQRGDFWSAD